MFKSFLAFLRNCLIASSLSAGHYSFFSIMFSVIQKKERHKQSLIRSWRCIFPHLQVKWALSLLPHFTQTAAARCSSVASKQKQKKSLRSELSDAAVLQSRKIFVHLGGCAVAEWSKALHSRENK